MLKTFKALIVVSVLLLMIWGGGRLYFSLTDGFTVSNIRSDLTFNADWEANFDEQNILNQPYTYLGKGCQFYTLISADGKYVLKFFKHKHLRNPRWITFFTWIGFDSYSRDRVQKKANKVNALFSSCKLAFDELQQETGLVAIHLNKTEDRIKTKTKIIDKMGFTHTLDLNEFEFIVQRAALPVKGTIDRWMSSGDEGKAKIALGNLGQVIVTRNQKGIADKDPAFIQNMGLLEDGSAFIIDVGQLVKEKGNDGYTDLNERMATFLPWLSENYPSLTQDIF